MMASNRGESENLLTAFYRSMGDDVLFWDPSARRKHVEINAIRVQEKAYGKVGSRTNDFISWWQVRG
jgi:hypothetical protein